MKSVTGRKLVFLLISLVLLGSLGGAAAAEELVVAVSGEPTTLDPHKTFNGYSFMVTNQVFETLVRKTPEGFQPELATDWEMLNPTTWRFTLRRGVVFHNGDPFNAESVEYSIKRLIDPETAATGAFVLSMVEDVRVVDEYTVDIATKAPFAPLLAHLTHPVTAIVNKRAVAEYGEDVGQHPIGTGPYKLAHWTPGTELILEASEDYWDGVPEIGTIKVRVIPEGSTRLTELQAGTVDLVFHVAPDKLASLEKNPEIAVHKALGWGSTFLGFNTKSGPTADVRVRKAIAHAIDRDAIVTQLRQGMAVKATAPIPETVWGAHTELSTHELDLEKARELLGQAGYPDGFAIELLLYQNEELQQLAQALQYLLGKVGIEVDVQVMDYGAYAARVSDENHGLFLSGWGTVTLDADYTLYALFHSSEIPTNNTSFYRNPQVDALLEKARQEADPEVRQRAYAEAQELINEDLPLLTLYYPLFSYAKNKRLQGEKIHYSWINLDLSKAQIAR